MNPQSRPAWRRGLPGLIVALTLWLSAPMAVAAEPELTRPRPPEDPRWLDLLPPLTLPLEKPAARAAGTVAPAGTDVWVPDAPPATTLPALAEPAPWLVEIPQIPLATSLGPDMDDAAAMAGIPEETEDAALIDVIETLPIAQAADAPETPVVTEPSADESIETSGYRWHVQLLAGRSLERVKEDQRLFVHRYGDLLQGLTLTISQSRYGDARDEFYRLRAIEWANRQAAVAWCDQLRSHGHQCLVTRILRRAG